jgi:hypothetical protein
MHVDGNNLGPSYVVGIGDFTEGQLWVEGKGVIDVHNTWTAFDGNVPHMTLPFSGNRFTFIFFTHMSYKKSRASCLAFVKAAIRFPTPKASRYKANYPPKKARLAAARGEATLVQYHARKTLGLFIPADMEKMALAQIQKKSKGVESEQKDNKRNGMNKKTMRRL